MCPSFCLCSSQLVYPPLQSDGSLARSRLAVICGPASASPAVTASEVPSWREHLFPEPLGGLPLTASSRKCHQLKRSHLSKAEAAPVTGGSQRAKVQPPCHNLGQLLGATPASVLPTGWLSLCGSAWQSGPRSSIFFLLFLLRPWPWHTCMPVLLLVTISEASSRFLSLSWRGMGPSREEGALHNRRSGARPSVPLGNASTENEWLKQQIKWCFFCLTAFYAKSMQNRLPESLSYRGTS